MELLPDVRVTDPAHHHCAPGAHVRQHVVVGGAQLTLPAVVEGLLVAQPVLLLAAGRLAADLVLVLDSLEMLSKHRGGLVHIAEVTLKKKHYK